MADVFFSYSRKDGERIAEIVSMLEQSGISVYWDRHVLGGEPWRTVVTREIEDARCVVVAWSRHSVDSRYVPAEAELGRERGRLVPIRLDDSVCFGFGDLHTIALSDWNGSAQHEKFSELLTSIRHRLRAPAPPEPPDEGDPPPELDSARVLREFGKVGVLIDDAPLAGNRVARELYGADQLPAWWIACRTIEQGESALRSLLQARDHVCPKLVVVDRLLPFAEKEPPCYWDREPSCSAFQALVARVQALHAAEPLLMPFVAITSYPRREIAGTPRLSWEPRFHEPLFQLRRRLSETNRPVCPLLRYAPEDTAPIVASSAASDHTTTAHHRARHASALIRDVAARLRDPNGVVVLLTGAGMSQRSSSDHAGMPDHNQLLTEAAWSTLAEINRKDPRDFASRDQPLPGWATFVVKDKSRIVELLQQCARDGSVRLDRRDVPEFSALFRPSPCEYEQKFRRHFQRAVMRYDEGICYQHWLAAKLPFKLIVSTNFDSFHERAAAQCAATQSRTRNVEVETPRVIKPYGDASQSASMRFSRDELRGAFRKLFQEMSEFLKKQSRKKLALVIVGHSCRDTEVFDRISCIDDAVDARITWVVPEAYDAHQSTDAGTPPIRLFQRRLFPSAKDAVEPLPLRAMDFFYDLWEEYLALEQ